MEQEQRGGSGGQMGIFFTTKVTGLSVRAPPFCTYKARKQIKFHFLEELITPRGACIYTNRHVLTGWELFLSQKLLVSLFASMEDLPSDLVQMAYSNDLIM
jgi:hypothetical protein